MKTKKLTALMASALLAISAVPMVSGAEVLKGDVNQNGIIDSADADLLLDFIFYYYNGDEDSYTEEEIQHYLTYGDIDGDGDVYFDDLILMGEINSDITLNTEMGDVNHDGYVNAIDATAVLCYYGDLSTDNYDKYTKAQHENFQTYGNMTKDELGDDKVDALDATWILLKYTEKSTTE
ncbi:MAG: dockerin type I domain-containing protein [Prevotella sp.]|nr:dockerin type I domain-containing protein [Alistipes senegalensis]MCM1357295.1 dockerin type I domain-containing protein [Prevotella sp.]MCM1473128.1 dockerin type I domain-containing protein [Muribaculaceae bacterium]